MVVLRALLIVAAVEPDFTFPRKGSHQNNIFSA
jgi:hypothetical protein